MATRCRHQNLDHFLAHKHWHTRLAYHQTKGWFLMGPSYLDKNFNFLIERILSAKHTPDLIHLPTTILDIADLSDPRDPNHTPSSPFGSRNPWFNSFSCTDRAWHPTVQESAILFLGSGVLHLHLHFAVRFLTCFSTLKNITLTKKNDNLRNTWASPHSRINIILSRQGSNPTSCYRTMNTSVQGHIKIAQGILHWSM